MSKKESAPLLAFLGEECWRTAKERGELEPSCKVAWVKDRIVVMERIGEHMRIRIGAVLAAGQEEAAENLLAAAAMRESGDYHFEVRHTAGFWVAEISAYIPFTDNAKELLMEASQMESRLGEALDSG